MPVGAQDHHTGRILNCDENISFALFLLHFRTPGPMCTLSAVSRCGVECKPTSTSADNGCTYSPLLRAMNVLTVVKAHYHLLTYQSVCLMLV